MPTTWGPHNTKRSAKVALHKTNLTGCSKPPIPCRYMRANKGCRGKEQGELFWSYTDYLKSTKHDRKGLRDIHVLGLSGLNGLFY